MDVPQGNRDGGGEESSEKVTDVEAMKDESETCDLSGKIRQESERVATEINALKDVAKDCYKMLKDFSGKFQDLTKELSAIRTLMGKVSAQEVKEIRDDLDSTVNNAEKDLLDIRSTVNSLPTTVMDIEFRVSNFLFYLDSYKLPKCKLKHNEIFHIYSPLNADDSLETDTSYEDIDNITVDESVDETAV